MYAEEKITFEILLKPKLRSCFDYCSSYFLNPQDSELFCQDINNRRTISFREDTFQTHFVAIRKTRRRKYHPLLS